MTTKKDGIEERAVAEAKAADAEFTAWLVERLKTCGEELTAEEESEIHERANEHSGLFWGTRVAAFTAGYTSPGVLPGYSPDEKRPALRDVLLDRVRSVDR